MAINENDRAHAFRIDPPPAAVFDPRLAAMEIDTFHKTDEAFALEATGGGTGGAFSYAQRNRGPLSCRICRSHAGRPRCRHTRTG